MATLMGKYKNGEWLKIDKTNPDSDFTAEQEQKDYLISEYKLIEPEWMFKWVEEKEVEIEIEIEVFA